MRLIIRICPAFAILPMLFVSAQAQESAESAIANPAGYVRWDSDFIQSVADRLERELGDKAMVWETVGNYEGHSIYLVLRGKTGQAEIHKTESDVQIGVRGTAESVIGGQIIDGKELP